MVDSVSCVNAFRHTDFVLGKQCIIMSFMVLSISRSLWIRKLCLITAVILVLSFVFHAVGLEHEHSHFIFGHGLGAQMHTDNRKIWLFALLGAITLAGFMLGKTRNILRTWYAQLLLRLSPPNSHLSDLLSIFDPISVAFRRGILQPKICE